MYDRWLLVLIRGDHFVVGDEGAIAVLLFD